MVNWYDTEAREINQIKKSEQTEAKSIQEPESEEAATGMLNGSNVYSSKSDCQGILHTLIIPVILSQVDNLNEQIMTNAFLDNMSDSCFIKTGMITQLQADSEKTDWEVTTLIEKRVIKTDVVQSLTVQGLCQSSILQLPRTYGKDDIPIDRSLIQRPKTVRQWPHLQNIAE